MGSKINVRIAQQREDWMVKGGRRELDLSTIGRGTVLRNDPPQQLKLNAAKRGLVMLGEAAPLLDERLNARILEIERIDPRQLVPHLQVAQVVGREMRGLAAGAQPTPGRLALGEQFRISRIRRDHAR